ncbi:MAG: DUF480 domain-containing protein [Actinobacteria bacterium]|nr:DUF480 domain-containing protein [Actinomycetota bacterium]
MVELVLNPMEQRILGALLEKQVTVPASYPLSLNALRTACNQTSSRDPITAYEDRELEQCARELKHRELIRVVVADRGQRTLKYHQRLDEQLELAADERALVTVLLLRGAQAPGELKTRTERLHPFADRGEVEEVLARMAAAGLVRELPRRPGQHDNRWVHLLGPVESEAVVAAEAAAVVDREAVLAAGAPARDEKVRRSYDAVAAAYADGAVDLSEKLFDAWLLDRLAMEATGPVADVGTGPGTVAAYLAEQGVDVTGYDCAPAMIEQARLRVPGATFEVGDLRRLLRPPTAPGWGAITCWYGLVYLAASELPAAVAGLARVLAPGGLLLVAMHAGDDVRHESELAGVEVDMELVLHDPAQVRAAVEAAGLVVEEWYVRGARPGEYPTDRLYVLARRPA